MKRDVSGVFRWSVEEAEFLIAAPTGDMWNRGDLGQSVYMLLAADPGCDDLLAAVVGTTDDDEIRWRATTVRVARAGEDGLEVLDRLAEAVPELRRAELFRELRQTLLEHGSVSLW